MRNFMYRRKKHEAASKNKEDEKKQCKSFCCGSRLCVSSSSSSSGGIKSSDTEQMDCLSSFAHGVVHARLEQMVNEEEDTKNHAHRRRGGRRDHQYLRAGDREEEKGGGGDGGSRFIVLMALETSSEDPKADFRRSMMEVITVRRLQEPRELRRLLNCYMSVNSRETRLVILQAFYEVCCSLYVCKL